MQTKLLGLLLVGALVISACGDGSANNSLPDDPDAPVLSIRSEGGFAPIEWSLRQGPRYVLLADGRLIFQGPQIDIFPGPMMPNYQMIQLTPEDLDALITNVKDMGLPGITEEFDNSAADHVADASTEVITYWNATGPHTYSAYALGIDLSPKVEASRIFSEIIEFLDDKAFRLNSTPYQPENLRVLAGASRSFDDAEFVDDRPWPLPGQDPSTWSDTVLDWKCTTVDGDQAPIFDDATDATRWVLGDDAIYQLLVRPLLPGEDDCPSI